MRSLILTVKTEMILLLLLLLLLIIIIMQQKPLLIIVTIVTVYWFKYSFFILCLKMFQLFMLGYTFQQVETTIRFSVPC